MRTEKVSASSKGSFETLLGRIVLEDGFQWDALMDWLRRYQGKLIGSIVAVVCVLGVMSGMLWYRETQRQKALRALESGMVALQVRNFKEAITHLENAEEVLGRTIEGKLALILLGDSWRGVNEKEKMIAAYKEAESIPQSIPYLDQMLLFKLGQHFESAGDMEQAQLFYEKGSGLEGPLRADSLLASARIAEQRSDKTVATTRYELFLEQYSNLPLTDFVKEKVGK